MTDLKNMDQEGTQKNKHTAVYDKPTFIHVLENFVRFL